MLAYRWRLLPIQALVDLTGPLNVLGVTVLLPFAQVEFDVPRVTIVWLIVGYSLGTASFILPAAYLGNTIGRKKVLMLGAGAGLASQMLAFWAPGIGWLISMRIVSGVANALMMANIPALTVGGFPESSRGKILGIMAIGLGVGILMAPVVAGIMADTVGWRYIFVLIAVLYGAVLVGTAIVVRQSRPDGTVSISVRRFDYPGVLFGMGALVFLVLGMQQFGAQSGLLVGLLLLFLGVGFGVTFVLLELHSPYPVFNPRLFQRSAFSLAVIRNVIVLGMWSSNGFLLSFYMIQGLDWSGAFAGTVLLAHYAGRLITSPLSGYLVDRIGPERPIALAFLLVVLGASLLITFGNDPSMAHILGALFIVGAGFGLFAPPIQTVLYANVPPEKLSLAPGIYSLSAHLGITVGAALAAAMMGLFLEEGIPWAFQRTIMVMIIGFITLFALSGVLLSKKWGGRINPWRD